MSVTDVVPLIKVPDAWPVPVVATLAMVCLAGLDLAGAVLAKEWASNGSVRALVLGAGAFLVLFWVYASSLRYAELALVTMGWVVMLQVGLVLIDRHPLAERQLHAVDPAVDEHEADLEHDDPAHRDEGELGVLQRRRVDPEEHDEGAGAEHERPN